MLKSLNLFRILLALAAGWILLFYIHYGKQAWFFCDDFSFLEQYQHSPHLAQALDFSSFGRPLSRNVYWYIGQQFFGRNAQLFFCTQFVHYACFVDIFLFHIKAHHTS